MKDHLPFAFRGALPWIAFTTVLFWFNYSARAMLSPLLVSMEADMNLGHTAATSLLFMQGLGFCAAQFACGFCLSRICPFFMTGGCIVASGLVLTAMLTVHGLGQGRLVFMVFGFTAGFYFPSAMAVLSSLVFPGDWGKAVAVHELAPNVGFILLPLLAQAGLLLGSWQTVFAALGVLMVLMGAAFFAFGKGGRACTAPPSFRGVSGLVRDPALAALVLLITTTAMGEFSVFSVLQIYLVGEQGFAPHAANMAISAVRLVTPLAVVAGGWAADRYSVYRAMTGGMISHAVALGLMCVPGAPVMALLGLGIQVAAVAMLFPVIFKAMAFVFPADQQPLVMSLSMPVSGLMASALAPLYLGWCGEYFSFAAGFATLAILSLACLGAVACLARRHGHCGDGPAPV
ncbi:MAG: MFS transporter [Desulfovibrionaceae bacterium]|nr:MFS transporter [Desulfovibrionaceae bacterium]